MPVLQVGAHARGYPQIRAISILEEMVNKGVEEAWKTKTWERMQKGKQGHSHEGKMVWRQKHEDEMELEERVQVCCGKQWGAGEGHGQAEYLCNAQ